MNIDDFKKVQNIIDEYKKKIDLSIKIQPEEFERRYEKVWEKMKERNLDVGFFYWYREMPGDGIYLTGYNPNIERACGMITVGKRPILLAGPESGIMAAEAGLGLKTYFIEEVSIPDEYYEGITYRKMEDVLHEYMGDQYSRIGLLTADDYVPARFVKFLETGLRDDVELIYTDDILADLRYEKSPTEMQCMKQADMIAVAGLRAMLAVLKPGLRETEVAAVGDYVLKSLGAIGYGFETIVNSGRRCTTVIGSASNKVIEEGEIVQVGISPDYEGYKGVSRRAVVVGERSELQKEYFKVLNTAYTKAAETLKDVVENDKSINLIDLAARNYFATQEVDGLNMKAFHLFSTAHGTGLTECLEQLVIHPEKEEYYGENVGIMLDLGNYGHPNIEICGGCVEDAYFKEGKTLHRFSDLPVDVQHLVGKGI